MSIRLRVSENELAAIRGYAELHGLTVSGAVRSAILERIENELDVKIAEQAYSEWIKEGKKTYSIKEVQTYCDPSY